MRCDEITDKTATGVSDLMIEANVQENLFCNNAVNRSSTILAHTYK